MLGVDFFIKSIFADRNNNFQLNFLYPIVDIDFLNSNVNKYFSSDNFCKVLGVQQCRSTTVPKKAGNFQNNLHAFSKERESTDANYPRKSLQFWRQYVCNCKINNYFGAKTSELQKFSLKILKFYLRL